MAGFGLAVRPLLPRSVACSRDGRRREGGGLTAPESTRPLRPRDSGLTARMNYMAGFGLAVRPLMPRSVTCSRDGRRREGGGLTAPESTRPLRPRDSGLTARMNYMAGFGLAVRPLLPRSVTCSRDGRRREVGGLTAPESTRCDRDPLAVRTLGRWLVHFSRDGRRWEVGGLTAPESTRCDRNPLAARTLGRRLIHFGHDARRREVGGLTAPELTRCDGDPLAVRTLGRRLVHLRRGIAI